MSIVIRGVIMVNMQDATEPTSLCTSPIVAHQSGASNHADGQDMPTAWHYGNPLVEQSALEKPSAVGLLDGWDRVAIVIGGEDRLQWLNSLISQKVNAIQPGQTADGLVLTAQGHVQYQFRIHCQQDSLVLDIDAANAEGLTDYLTNMVFWSQVTIEQPHWAALSLISRSDAVNTVEAPSTQLDYVRHRGPWTIRDLWVDRHSVTTAWSALTAHKDVEPIGGMAAASLRIEQRIPAASDLDERTIPHEVGFFIGSQGDGPTQLETASDGPSDGAVHINKGCYRGQETVSRVHNLGKAPRRLVLLHLDGSANRLPAIGSDVTAGGRVIGRVGTSSQHSDFGPIALALIKRSVVETLATTPDRVPPLLADGIDAAIDSDDLTLDTRQAPGRAAIKKLRG